MIILATIATILLIAFLFLPGLLKLGSLAIIGVLAFAAIPLLFGLLIKWLYSRATKH
ncbi:MAG: hypothetical protein ACTHLK_21985 [Brucella intermedia]